VQPAVTVLNNFYFHLFISLKFLFCLVFVFLQQIKQIVIILVLVTKIALKAVQFLLRYFEKNI